MTSRTPVFMRAYVTATRLLTRGEELDDYAHELDRHLNALPNGAAPLAALELTTRRGHFMGRARSRFLIFEHAGGTYLRDVGSWTRCRRTWPCLTALAAKVGLLGRRPARTEPAAPARAKVGRLRQARQLARRAGPELVRERWSGSEASLNAVLRLTEKSLPAGYPWLSR